MGRRIIKQPDGKYAIWSTIVDSFICKDCTQAELVEIFIEEENRRFAQRCLEVADDVNRIVRALDEGGSPYGEVTSGWKELTRLEKKVHHDT